MKRALPMVFLCLSMHLFGQVDSKNVSFKLYTGFDYSPSYLYHESSDPDDNALREYRKEINGLNFSPALVFYNLQGNAHEIEISRFKYARDYKEVQSIDEATGTVNSTLSGSMDQEFEIFVRYEYQLRLLKKKEQKACTPVIGFSATPFFKWSSSNPLISNEYPSSETSIGLYLSVIPGMEYAINDRWYLDLDFPVALVTSRYSRNRIDSPNLPENERVNGVLDFYNGPLSFALRFGVGIHL